MIRGQLAVYLGPFTARNAVRTFSKQVLGTNPEDVTPEQVPQLLGALGPALRTLLGEARAKLILEKLRNELHQ